MVETSLSVLALIDAATKVCRSNESELARTLGLSPQSVSSWKKGKRPVPPRQFARMAEMVFGVERAKELTWQYVTVDHEALCIM